MSGQGKPLLLDSLFELLKGADQTDNDSNPCGILFGLVESKSGKYVEVLERAAADHLWFKALFAPQITKLLEGRTPTRYSRFNDFIAHRFVVYNRSDTAYWAALEKKLNSERDFLALKKLQQAHLEDLARRGAAVSARSAGQSSWLKERVDSWTDAQPLPEEALRNLCRRFETPTLKRAGKPPKDGDPNRVSGPLVILSAHYPQWPQDPEEPFLARLAEAFLLGLVPDEKYKVYKYSVGATPKAERPSDCTDDRLLLLLDSVAEATTARALSEAFYDMSRALYDPAGPRKIKQRKEAVETHLSAVAADTPLGIIKKEAFETARRYIAAVQYEQENTVKSGCAEELSMSELFKLINYRDDKAEAEKKHRSVKQKLDMLLLQEESQPALSPLLWTLGAAPLRKEGKHER